MNKKIKQSILFLTLLPLTLPAAESWRDPFDVNINVNNQEPITLQIDTTFGLSLSQQTTYNLLCLALGITGGGILYSGIKEFFTCDQNKAHIKNKKRWWKPSIGLCITTAAFIAIFQFDRLDRLLSYAS